MMEKQTMRRLLTALAMIIAAGPAAHAACKDEVASALERQRKTSGFRMQTKMLSEQGLVDIAGKQGADVPDDDLAGLPGCSRVCHGGSSVDGWK